MATSPTIFSSESWLLTMPIVLRRQSKKSASERNLSQHLRAANRALVRGSRIGLLFLLLLAGAFAVPILLQRYGLPERNVVGIFAILTFSLFVLVFGYLGISTWKYWNWTEEVRTLCETADVQDTGALLETLEVIRRMDSSLMQEANRRDTE